MEENQNTKGLVAGKRAKEQHGQLPTSRRFRIRFGLRAIMLLVLGSAIVMFTWIGPGFEQRQIVKLLRQNNLQVEYAAKPFFIPQFVFEKIGADFFSRVTHVVEPDNDWNSIEERHEITHTNSFPFIKQLHIPNGFEGMSLETVFPKVNTVTMENPDHVDFLKTLPSLKLIYDKGFREEPYPLLPSVTSLHAGISPTPFDCKHLNSFPNLETLIFDQHFKNFSSEYLPESLKMIKFGNYGTSGIDLDLQPVAKLTNLEMLIVRGFDIKDTNLLKSLPRLRHIEFGGDTNADLLPLYSMPRLKTVILGKSFTAVDCDALQTARPNISCQLDN